eukprot:jgi/Picre1/28570/NNA_003972.t1
MKRDREHVNGTAACEDNAMQHGERVTADASSHGNDASSLWMDCVFQVNHYSHAKRLMEYFEDESIRHVVFPRGAFGAASKAQYLGYPCGVERTGTYLLMFENVGRTGKEWVDWMDASFLQHCVNRMFLFGGAYEDGTASSIENVVAQLSASDGVIKEKESAPVRIMCCPRPLEKEFLDAFGDDGVFEFHPVNFTRTLHIIQKKDGSFRYCLRPACETFHTKPDGDARVAGQFCKAAGKLHEALLVTGFWDECRKKDACAIDIGAAPGGWTHQLAKDMHTVIAIDPAMLHESVAALDNVHHVQKVSQDAGPDIDRIMENATKKEVDLITCDANRDPFMLGKMLAPALKYLRPGGMLVVTLKFRGNGARNLDKSIKALSDAFTCDITGMKNLCLMANTQNERTIVARRAI